MIRLLKRLRTPTTTWSKRSLSPGVPPLLAGATAFTSTERMGPSRRGVHTECHEGAHGGPREREARQPRLRLKANGPFRQNIQQHGEDLGGPSVCALRGTPCEPFSNHEPRLTIISDISEPSEGGCPIRLTLSEPHPDRAPTRVRETISSHDPASRMQRNETMMRIGVQRVAASARDRPALCSRWRRDDRWFRSTQRGNRARRNGRFYGSAASTAATSSSRSITSGSCAPAIACRPETTKHGTPLIPSRWARRFSAWIASVSASPVR